MKLSRITSRQIDKLVRRVKIQELGAGKIKSDLENKTLLRLKTTGENMEFEPPRKNNMKEKEFLKYINKKLKKQKMYLENYVCYSVGDGKNNRYEVLGFFYKERSK